MRIDHGGLLVSDVRRAVRFYVDALGLPEVPRPSTFDTPGAWLQVGEQQLHLIGETEPGRAKQMTPDYDHAEVVIGYGTHLALEVDDLDAALARAAAAGVRPPGEVFARGDGVKRVFLTDPDGHVIELMQSGIEVTGEEPRLKAPKRG
ncbi:VOC family protein [Solirubrobacter sp. CPCC 204708]|uniref:VOC family protein n=1 Tax=Solirubrobacter deserti TaxID=2282478 RepID=A0ABT4RE81_9ACTN|nr:VOC family protein [Solirubrobacter deserti]MBE2316095.1 VOC family protein [Solirubrobacter deserti]MDA0136845.1 VOC family protein [Solirubrobacter deserti]